jgi:hypothetical protein
MPNGAEATMFLIAAAALSLFWSFALLDLRRWGGGQRVLAFPMVRWRLGRVFLYAWLTVGAIAIPLLLLRGLGALAS